MNHADKVRLVEIEKRIDRVKHVLEGLMPVFQTVRQKVQVSEEEISRLEEERAKLQQGQLTFDEFSF